MAAIVAVTVSTKGRRETVRLHIDPSEAEPFWTTSLRNLVKRGLQVVKLVVSDAHEGSKVAITRVVGATRQRCRIHLIRNALGHVPKDQTTVVAAAIRQVLLQPDHPSAGRSWRHTDVVGIFPNEDSITRLIGAVFLEANDEWQFQHHYMQAEGMAELA